MNVFTANQQKVIIIGRQYENDVTTIQFPIKKWRDAFGNSGNFFLSVMRAKDPAPYEVNIEVADDYVLWTPNDTDTQYKGYGEAQLTYRIDGKVAKSEVFQIYTDRSLPQTGDAPPEWQGFVDRVEEAADEALNAADRAESAKGTAEIAKNAAEEFADQARIQADYAQGIMGLSTFEINAESGMLTVTYPIPYYGAIFRINQNGELEVVNNG